jgi:hypothetical protein
MIRNQEPAAADAPTEEKTAAEVYKSLHAKVKVIRDRRGLSIADVFQKYGGPGIEREYRRVVGEMNAEIGGEG